MAARVLPLGDAAPAPEVLSAVREELARERVVAFPTETVYGLAVRSDSPAAIENLLALKASPPGRPLTWHVGSAAALDGCGELAALARRLARRYWPGPLTLVVKLASAPPGVLADREGFTGLRFPAHAGTSGILAALDFPVVMTSANRAGAPPHLAADEVVASFGAHGLLILDGGRARLAEASAVLKLGRGLFELRRPGLYRLDELRRAAGLRIGFACTGNTCRSPMAQALAEELVAERLGVARDRLPDFGFEISSLGTAAWPGSPASPEAVSVVRELGGHLHGHVARAAQDVDLARFDRLYGMTRAHCDALAALLPPERRSIVESLHPGLDVPDPIGAPVAVYRRTAELIRAALDARAAEWA